MAAADASVRTQNGTIHSTGNKNHNMPPSKVIHCRAVAEGCKETDLVQVMKLFGNIKALKLMPKISQGLVEFEELESAIACVTYSHIQPILVHGRQMYINYSKSVEINREFSNSNQGQAPTNILLLTVINVIHPVNVDTIKKICEQQNTEVQRIVIFHKNGLQALVEFKTIDDASRIQQALNGCDIYPGCCTLKIEYSKTTKLNVRSNTSESFNIDIGVDPFNQSYNQRYGDFQSEKLNSEVSALLAGTQGLSTIQNIISRVMGGGSMNDNQRNPPAGVKTLLSNNHLDFNTNGYSSNPSTNRTTLLQHNYMEPSQPNYLDQYNSPFSALNNGSSSTGGDGCVAMVYGISNDVMNCGHLYNLFCLYGNVVKIKILVNKPGCGMVQYADRLSTEMAIQYLNNLTLFEQQFQISFSKHPFIAESSQTSTVFDGSQSVISFYESRNNRFKFLAGGKNDFISHIHPPSKVLHYFNAPPDCTEQRLDQLFDSYNVEVPVKHASISKSSGKSSSGLLEFSSISAAVEALILVNHVTLHKDNINGELDASGDKPGAPFTFKLAFSPSASINK